jgi:two-component system nitrogen regulation sensor histidine kinase NtrY
MVKGGYYPRVTTGTTHSILGRGTAVRELREPWMLGASVVVLLAARWLQAPGPGIASLLFLALIVIGALTWKSRGVATWRRGLFFVAAAVLLASAVRHQVTLRRIADDGEAVRSARAVRGAERLAKVFSQETADLARIARAALDAPDDQAQAFDALTLLLPPSDGKSVLLARGGVPTAWHGRLLVPLDSMRGPAGVIAAPFYLVAYAKATRGDDVAVATLLLHAEAPADRLTSPLDAQVARRTGVRGFIYAEPEAAEIVSEARLLRIGETPVVATRAYVADVAELRTEAWADAVIVGGMALAVMGLLLLAVAWRRDTGLGPRFSALTVAFGVIAMVPFEQFGAFTSLFDPAFFSVASGWKFTANAGALALSAALLLLALLSLRRARFRFRTRTSAVIAVILVAGAGPFLLRELARGVQVPTLGVPFGQWIAWQVTIFLATVSVLLLGVTAGQGAVGRARGLPLWIAPSLAVLAALMAPLLLEAPGRFPPAYTALWAIAIAALAFTRRARAMVLPVALVAASGAVTLVWFSVTRERVSLAVRDVQGLGRADAEAAARLERFILVLDRTRASRTRVELLGRFAQSELASAEFPTELATWAADGSQMAELVVGRAPGATYGVNLFAAEVQRTRRPAITELDGDPGIHLLLSVPHLDGTATTVVVAPRSRLVGTDPFGNFIGFSAPPAPEPPYTLRLGDFTTAPASPENHRGGWIREGNELHGDWQLRNPGGLSRRLHAVVELRSFDVLATRGVLVVMLDLAVLGLVWLLIVSADGALLRWWRQRRREILSSYRTRLTVALFACFLLPSVLFGLWSFRRLQADDRQARDLLVRETLRGIATSTDSVQLQAAAIRFETPLFLYADGLLVGTSDPVLDAIAPVGRLLPPSVMRTLAEGDEITTGREQDVGPAAVRLGYRAATDSSGVRYVLAAPARLDDRSLDRRRNDLALFLLFALAMGAIAALWASGAASRQLSRPIRALRESALALARGEYGTRLRDDPPLEFQPVFRAFGRMTTDLAEGRTALEAAERRLAATLRNVASGVIVADGDARVTFFNPRAETMLGVTLAVGALLPPPAALTFGAELTEFQSRDLDDLAIEFDHRGRRLNISFARLARDTRHTVITLDDVTEVARAERVLAWGEMARQVAHEIKNPLTPMRLGLQHLRRARRDGRVDFDRVLDENTARMLAEIDRLDEIARSFSRYGAAPTVDAPAVRVDVSAVATDVIELERMGDADVAWESKIPDAPIWAAARDRELREVLLNLLENARLAKATVVRLTVEAFEGGAELRVHDDGTGIAPELLERIFEPHFSTRTSGSGLGLAISRRIIEGWGGTISAESAVGHGTTLRIRLATPPRA